MEHTLSHTLSFRGKKYENVTLSDYFKTRHKLVLSQNIKRPEEEQHRALLMSFCENIPPESFDDIPADDMDFIAEHVNEIMTKYAESHGAAGESSRKKKTRPPRQASRPGR